MAHKFKIDGYIADRIFNKPLLLEENKARVIANYLEKRISGQIAINGGMQMPMAETETECDYEIVQGVAIIQLVGTLVHRGGSMDAESGLLSYQLLRQKLIHAANNSNVKTILLEIDSGGGEVEGNFDLARLIRFIHNEYKPVVAIANGTAFSGAFSLGVSAGKLFVTETGGVGSVGVIIQHVDISKNNEMNGIVITNITAGDRKAELSHDFPLSVSGRETLQNEVNRINDMFVALVSDMRGISENIIRDTQAALLFGNESVSMGFVDGVISFDQLLESLIDIVNVDELGTDVETNDVSETPKDDLDFALIKQRINEMDFLKKKTKTAKVESEAVETTEAVATTEVVESQTDAKSDEDVQKAETTADQQANVDPVETVSNPVEAAAAIVEVCAAGNMAHLAAGFIREGVSLEVVKEKANFKKEVEKLCATAKMPDLVDTYLASGKNIKAIQDDLISKLANSQQDISGKPDPEAVKKDLSSAKNVIEADLEKRFIKSNK